MLIFRRSNCISTTLVTGDWPLVTCVLNSHPKRVTIPDAVLIQLSPEDEHNSARNM